MLSLHHYFFFFLSLSFKNSTLPFLPFHAWKPTYLPETLTLSRTLSYSHAKAAYTDGFKFSDEVGYKAHFLELTSIFMHYLLLFIDIVIMSTWCVKLSRNRTYCIPTYFMYIFSSLSCGKLFLHLYKSATWLHMERHLISLRNARSNNSPVVWPLISLVPKFIILLF